jgi:hypothetical protein
MLRVNEIARQLVDAEKAGKAFIVVSHGNKSVRLTLEKVNQILHEKIHYAKKVWQNEIDALEIMNVCEQRLHRVCQVFGIIKGMPKLEAKQANVNKMLCKSLQLHSTQKDLLGTNSTKKVEAKKLAKSLAKSIVKVKKINGKKADKKAEQKLAIELTNEINSLTV